LLDGGDTEYECTWANCCGQLFTDCYISGYCGEAKKAGMSPAVRKYLEELPLDSELLVADCNGH